MSEQEKKVLLRLSDLAITLRMNKSKLNYYASCGLFPTPESYGVTSVYDKDEIIRRLKIIKKRKTQGKPLIEIKNEFESSSSTEDSTRTN